MHSGEAVQTVGNDGRIIQMAGIQRFTRKHLTTLLLLLLAGGFAVILGELILYRHYSGLQLIGFISTIVGLVVALWGIIARGGTRVALAALMLLLSVAGVIGVVEHNEGGEGGEAQRPAAVAAANFNVSSSAAPIAQENESEDDARGGREFAEGGETAPPPLAPLGLSGLALMGAVVLLAKRDPEEVVAVK
jgi:hypothetical protein